MHHLYFPKSRPGETFGAAGYKETNRLPRKLKKRLKLEIKQSYFEMYNGLVVRTDWIRLLQVWYSDVWNCWRTNHQYRSQPTPWRSSEYHSQPVEIK